VELAGNFVRPSLTAPQPAPQAEPAPSSKVCSLSLSVCSSNSVGDLWFLCLHPLSLFRADVLTAILLTASHP
jgi:hypothetical protein